MTLFFSSFTVSELIHSLITLLIGGIGFYVVQKGFLKNRLTKIKTRLKEREARYSAVINQATEGIYLCSLETKKIIEANPAFLRLIGYSAEELLRMTLFDFVVRDPEKIEQNIQILKKQGTLFIGERKFRRKDGLLIDVEARANLIHYGKTEVACIVVHDISDRKKTEETLRKTNRRVIDILESMTDAFIALDDQWRLTYINPMGEKLFQKNSNDLLGKIIWGELPESAKHLFYDHFLKTITDQIPIKFEMFYLPLKSWFEAHVHPTQEGLSVYFRDITKSKLAAEALLKSQKRLAQAQRIAHLGNWELDIKKNELHWSDEVYHIFGLGSDEFSGDYEAFLSFVHPQDRELVKRSVNEALYEEKPFNFDHSILLSNGSQRIVHEQGEVIFNDQGNPVSIIGTVQDITEQKKGEELLNQLAYYDPLTSLPNRRLFLDRLHQSLNLARRYQSFVGILFLDTDRFKLINDSLGHGMGDLLLKTLSQRIRESLRASDTVARLGGDEFAIILPDLHKKEDAVTVGQKIMTLLSQPILLDSQEVFISISIGITIYPTDGSDVETLLKNADMAMYQAKDKGRNNYQFYTPDLKTISIKRLSLENDLRHALERREISLHYQPQVSLDTGEILGIEALARWKHSELGMISPVEFIPLAEETGLIIPIGEYVLRTACLQNKIWQEQGIPPLLVSVNLSGYQLKQPHIVETVESILKGTGLDARYLELELTESNLVQNIETTLVTLKNLKKMGVHLSIDDFGTGYSSLSYLKRFPVHTLKIDQSFVKNITTEPEDAAITISVITMAHHLKFKVIAEGVETEEQMNFLRLNRCDGMQGYFFSRPLPADLFTSLLLEGKRLNFNPSKEEPQFPGLKEGVL